MISWKIGAIRVINWPIMHRLIGITLWQKKQMCFDRELAAIGLVTTALVMQNGVLALLR